MKPLLSLLLLAVVLSVAFAKTDPSGRVRVLYVGNIVLTPILSTDPTIQVHPVPAYLFGMGERRVKKFLRIYMPRTYADLVSSNDAIYVGDSGVRIYTTIWLAWMAQGVESGGMGFVMSGGSESFGGRGEDPSWGDSAVGNVLPVTCRHVGSDSGFRKPFRLVIERPEDELMASLPFEDAPGFGYLNMEVFPKEGSTLLATASLPQRNPATVVMGVGEGRSVAFPPYITDPNPVVVPFAGWKYYIDFLPNLMIYTAQAPLPSDYLMMHRLRRKLGDYSDLRGLAVGVLSFAEGLGANTLAARKRIEVADGQLAEARDLFIKKDIAAAERSLDRAMETLKDAKSTAMKEKDRAFLWIYAIEYLAVTATLMISGALLWELMVRRIMYRETRITRSA